MEGMSFVAFGNPLIDTSIEIGDTNLLKKYGLKEDEQAEISAETLDLLLDDVEKRLQDFPDLSPGRCVCLVFGHRRSLVANIGAAGHYSLDRLVADQELQAMLDRATYVHTEGFFISNRFPVCRYLVEDVQTKRGKPLSYNLAAPYVIEQFPEESKYLAEHCDVLFGNAREYEALGSLYGMGDAEECALMLHSRSHDRNRMGLGKVIVVTDGCRPALVVWGREAVRKQRYVVPAPATILDTTGAGDAFLAGFIWSLMHNRSIDACTSFGFKLASTVISYIGVRPPPGLHLPTLE